MDEIVAFKQERLTGRRSERVGAAVAEVEASAMISFAKTAVGVPRQLQLVCIERNYVDPAAVQKEVEFAARRRPFPRFDNNAGLQYGDRRHDTRGVGIDCEGEEFIVRLAQEDGRARRNCRSP